MNKIFDYIFKGRGIGAFLLLAAAFAISVYTAVNVRGILTESIPYMQATADKILPIKVENGKTVVPDNTVKDIVLFDLGKNSLHFIIDTTKDTLDTNNLRQGIYLSRSYFYVVKNNEIRSTKLDGSFDLPKGDYTPFFKSVIKWSVIAIAVGGTFAMFFLFFILTLIYALCAGFSAAVTKKMLNFDTKMRLSAVAFTVIYALSTILEFAGYNLGKLIFFAAVIAVQILILKKMPQ